MRIQVSLNIVNPVVYEKCKHLKETKELNGVIVKLLTAYALNDEGINRVLSEVSEDGTSQIPMPQVEDIDLSADYKDIQETLMMLNVMTDDASNLLNSSAETFEAYVDSAVDMGVFKKESNKNGEEVVKPKLDIIRQIVKNEEKSNELFDEVFIMEQLKELTKTINSVVKDVSTIKGKLSGTINMDTDTDNEETNLEPITEVPVVEEVMVETPQPVVEEHKVAEQPIIQEQPVVQVTEPVIEIEQLKVEEPTISDEEQEYIEKDASSSIGDLLSSLGAF